MNDFITFPITKKQNADCDGVEQAIYWPCTALPLTIF